MTRVPSAVLVAVLLALPATACGRELALAKTLHERSLKGQYAYRGEGSTATIPWNFSALLSLDGKGSYDLTVDVTVKDDPDHDVDHGAYTVDGDHLTLDPDKHGEGHDFLIRGDSLIAETGWKGDAVLRMLGVPKPIFVKQ